MRSLAPLLVAALAAPLMMPMYAEAAEDVAAEIIVDDFFFDPGTVVVNATEQVQWTWANNTSLHGVETRSGNQEWCGPRTTGLCIRTFQLNGTYPYRCSVHTTAMLGNIVVRGDRFIDLVPVSLTSETGTGEATLHAEVANDGNVSAQDVRIRFEYRYKDEWRGIGTVTRDIATGGSVEVEVGWQDHTKIGEFTVRVVVDPLRDIPEPDDGNNIRSGTAAITTDLIDGIDLNEP